MVLGIAVVLGLGGLALAEQAGALPTLFQSAAPVTNSGEQKTVVQVVSEESAVIDAVKKASPAVVSIIASADVPKMERCMKDLTPPGFGGGFQFQMPGVCQNGTQNQEVGAGSGFLVSDDGYILTNNHVVEAGGGQNTSFTVILNDDGNKGEEVTATVLATDPTNDIAVLKIDKTGLPFLTFADSDQLQVGQTAIAIGYALGEFENTVSKGVVSGLSRSIEAGDQGGGQPEQLFGIIQTDAAINPGNSGGPLLDISGNVIGMDTAMASAQSIGFAIPANDVRSEYESVKNTGKITRAFLGVRYVMIDKQLQTEQSLAYDYGALVLRGQNITDLAVTPGSPADKAGIVENDIILAYNGQKIDGDHPLSSYINKATVGETITLHISHKGEEKDVQVTLDARPDVTAP